MDSLSQVESLKYHSFIFDFAFHNFKNALLCVNWFLLIKKDGKFLQFFRKADYGLILISNPLPTPNSSFFCPNIFPKINGDA